jgi:hypothetical protein
MTVYVGPSLYRLGRMVMCHMVADTPEELHAMAKQIGVRKWFQMGKSGRYPHYDVSKTKRKLAVYFGAVEADERQIVGTAKACYSLMEE